MYKIILFIHVLIGATALVSGAMAIFSKKGSGLHIKSGNIYYLAMWGIAITAVTMTLLKFNPFLLAIAIFSLYLSFSGRRSIKYWRLKTNFIPTLKDKLHIYIGLGTSLFMIGYPIVLMLNHHIFFVPVLSIFGIILLALTIKDISMYADNNNFQPKNKQWLILHIGQMGGAYIATITAFLLNNIQFNPSWVIWLLPTIVGAPIITISSKKWAKKLRVNKS